MVIIITLLHTLVIAPLVSPTPFIRVLLSLSPVKLQVFIHSNLPL